MLKTKSKLRRLNYHEKKKLIELAKKGDVDKRLLNSFEAKDLFMDAVAKNRMKGYAIKYAIFKNLDAFNKMITEDEHSIVKHFIQLEHGTWFSEIIGIESIIRAQDFRIWERYAGLLKIIFSKYYYNEKNIEQMIEKYKKSMITGNNGYHYGIIPHNNLIPYINARVNKLLKKVDEDFHKNKGKIASYYLVQRLDLLVDDYLENKNRRSYKILKNTGRIGYVLSYMLSEEEFEKNNGNIKKIIDIINHPYPIERKILLKWAEEIEEIRRIKNI